MYDLQKWLVDIFPRFYDYNAKFKGQLPDFQRRQFPGEMIGLWLIHGCLFVYCYCMTLSPAQRAVQEIHFPGESVQGVIDV